MSERQRSPEQPIPQMHEPAAQEDQKRAEESLEGFQAERAAVKHVLHGRPKDIYRDQADPKEKTLKTRHIGLVAKVKRKAKEISDQADKPVLNIKIQKRWDDHLKEIK